MKEKNISQYALIHQYKISTGQLDRLRKNENVNTHTLDLLCKILDCKLEDVAEYKNCDSNIQSFDEECDTD
ncbi:MAG: helix-turn-helix transcriptional regulator [Clostridia bacterium]|nr:helix-turn-helix transcriptional regulator [Clostridia bacterium]